jgi:hypothetical protein
MHVAQALLTAAAKVALTDLSTTSSIEHHGEQGRAREEVVRQFLRRFVPPAFGVDTGFVVDAHGAISRQVDIVIHRTDYHPIFHVGGVKHLMVESVVAAIENKADVGSAERLSGALENLASVKRLDRTGGDRNYVVMDFHGAGDPVEADNPDHQVWTAVVAQSSLRPQRVAEHLAHFCAGHPEREWPSLYVDVNDFVAFGLDVIASPRVRKAFPQDANAWAVATVEDEGIAEAALLDLASQLALRLRKGAIVDFDARAYFRQSNTHRVLCQFRWPAVDDDRALADTSDVVADQPPTTSPTDKPAPE